MAAIEKVKILVLGDSGVGKTSLTHLIANNEPLISPGWTIGCSVEVKVHNYKEGTQVQNPFFVEMWDVGGSTNHRSTSKVFYEPANGIVLVHDLTNRKSLQNLNKWLSDVLNSDEAKGSYSDSDPEQFIGATQIPILVIATKLDLVEEKFVNDHYRRLNCSIADQCGADEIFLNCHQNKSLAPGSNNAVKLTRFLDEVIERRYYPRVSPMQANKKAPSFTIQNCTPISRQKQNHHYLSPAFYNIE